MPSQAEVLEAVTRRIVAMGSELERNALAQLSYRLGKNGVLHDDANRILQQSGHRFEGHDDDPHDFWIVFELFGAEQRVHVLVP